MPAIDTMTRWTLAGTWLVDNNYWEMFLNFPMHPDLQKYCGINVTQLFPELLEEGEDMLVGAWLQCAMGMKSSPYICTQGAFRAKQNIKGDRHDSKNTFQWDHLEKNLPCLATYNATRPEVQKIRQNELTVSDIVQYMDDAQTLAATEELSWLAQSKTAKTLCYLGLQDAAQKRPMGSQRPGAWAGAVVSTDTGMVLKSVSRDQWVKTQQKVRWIAKYLEVVDDCTSREEEGSTEKHKACPDYLKLVDEFTSIEEGSSTEEHNTCPKGEIPFKQLERIVGFLVYVSQTYTCMVPYLKGIYLTLNS